MKIKKYNGFEILNILHISLQAMLVDGEER